MYPVALGRERSALFAELAGADRRARSVGGVGIADEVTAGAQAIARELRDAYPDWVIAITPPEPRRRASGGPDRVEASVLQLGTGPRTNVNQ